MVTIQVSSPANVLFFEECKVYNKLIQTVLVVVLALQRVIFLCFIFLILLYSRSCKKEEVSLSLRIYISPNFEFLANLLNIYIYSIFIISEETHSVHVAKASFLTLSGLYYIILF